MGFVLDDVPRLAIAPNGKERVVDVHVVAMVDHRRDVELLHVLKHTLALVNRKRLFKIDLAGLAVKRLGAVVAHEHAVVMGKVQLGRVT